MSTSSETGPEGVAVETRTDPPNPGSDEAVALGCTCPVLDNARGRGMFAPRCPSGPPSFWISAGCPLHHRPDARTTTHADKNQQVVDSQQAPSSATERFERLAEEFYRETGMLAPGKDQSAAMGGPDYETRYRAWTQRLTDRRTSHA